MTKSPVLKMPGPRSKRRPDSKQPSSVEEDGDTETEEAVDTSQTDEDKRRVRRTLRDLHDKLLQCKDGCVLKSFVIECLICIIISLLQQWRRF